MTSELEEALVRVKNLRASMTGLHEPPWEDCNAIDTILSALTASQAEVERLRRERDETNREARYLALWLFDTYYRHLPDQPEIKLLPEPAGVISQIDNMITGVRDRLNAAEARATRAEGLLEALANAADVVGVAYFDSDDLSPEVEAMQSATLAARAFLDKLKEQGQ